MDLQAFNSSQRLRKELKYDFVGTIHFINRIMIELKREETNSISHVNKKKELKENLISNSICN